MPELPEVETVRLQLEPVIVGRCLSSVAIDDHRLTRPFSPREIEQELTGCRVVGARRRGKYLIFELGAFNWIVHLRMTGSFSTATSGASVSRRHVRATIVLDDATVLRYVDVRRFGTWAVLDEAGSAAFLAERLGPEPLEAAFDENWLASRLEGSRMSLKAALLDQNIAAGVGNIYADESLWRANLHPARPAGTLSSSEIASLVQALRDSLERGISRQGATLRDYRAPDGTSGAMQDEFAVYAREGEPCERCAAPVAKTRVAGRGTWFCPSCQAIPARGRVHARAD